MRCRYCFAKIKDPDWCPTCGSRLTEKAGPAGRRRSGFSLVQIGQWVIGSLLFFGLLGSTLVIFFAPEQVPQPVKDSLPFLFQPTPTRRIVLTPTPRPTEIPFQRVTNQAVGFSLELPSHWLVIHQTVSNWPSRVPSDEYNWADSVFNPSPNTFPRTMIADPLITDLLQNRLFVMTAGTTEALSSDISRDQIEDLVQTQPSFFYTLAPPMVTADARNMRSEQLTVNGRPATLVTFTAQGTVDGRSTTARVYLYFISANEAMYLLSYVADERTATDNLGLYEQVIDSFDIR